MPPSLNCPTSSKTTVRVPSCRRREPAPRPGGRSIRDAATTADNLEMIISIILLAFLPDTPNHLFRSFPDFLPLKDLLSIFWTPDQMVGTVVDRMTRSTERHSCNVSYRRARA